MESTYTKVRRNGIEGELLTDIINKLGKDKVEKMGYELLASEPDEVRALRQLRTEAPSEVSTDAISEDVVVKKTREKKVK